jgi:hypothetical protein
MHTPDGAPGLNYLCDGFRAFFTHIDQPMRFMAALAARRAPANIMNHRKLRWTNALLEPVATTLPARKPQEVQNTLLG